MDVVYICRKGPNEELLYSLRSLANLPHGDVWVFGAAPQWYRGRLVHCPQTFGKQENTKRALRDACMHPDVSDPFVLMNDDFYVTRPIRRVPLCHRGRVRQVIESHRARRGESAYVRRMRATLALLEAQGYREPLSFELHAPMVVHKDIMLRALELTFTDVDHLQPRTIYGAMLGDATTRMDDVKVFRHGEGIPDAPFLSSADSSFDMVRPYLAGLFPDACEYEDEEVTRAMTDDRYVRMRKGNTTAKVHVGQVKDRKTRGWRVDEPAPARAPEPAPEIAPAPAVEEAVTPEPAPEIAPAPELPAVSEDMKRGELNEIARNEGVPDPEKLPNKGEVIAAITAKRSG